MTYASKIVHAFGLTADQIAARIRDDRPLPGFQFWRGSRVLKHCRSPMLLSRYRRWETLAAKHLPTLKDMYGWEEEVVLGHVMLLMREPQDFYYVFQGSDLVTKYGRNFRGERLTDVKGTLTEAFISLYRACADYGQPIYLQFMAEFSDQHIYWERLLLPLISDQHSQTTFVMTYSLPMDDALNILQAMFDRAPTGMIAAAKPIGEFHELSDARVVLINARARELLKLPPDSAPPNTLADLGAWFRGEASWSKLSQSTIDGLQTICYEQRDTGLTIALRIEPMGRFVLFHLSPLPGANSTEPPGK